MASESFVFYRSFAMALEQLPAEQYKKVMLAICQYGLDGNMPELGDPMLNAILMLIRPQIDANMRKRQNGAKGAETRWGDDNGMANDSKAMASDSKAMANHSKPMANDSKAMANHGKPAKPIANVNANVNVNENVNANENATANGEKEPLRHQNDDEGLPVTPSADVMDQRFNAFWAEYPKKVGRGDARKAFRKLAPSKALTIEMISAVRRASGTLQWQRDHGRFVPNPATWLNQERWKDEIPPDFGAPDAKKTAFHNFQEREAPETGIDMSPEEIAEMKRFVMGGTDG